MRIALLIDSLGSGGAQRQFVGLASILKKEGFEVKVFCYFDLPFYADVLERDNIIYEVIPNATRYYYRIQHVGKALSNYAPQLVIAYQETPSLIACFLKMLGAKWKLIVSERNTTQKNTWREILRFNLYRKANYVVPNSYSQENFIRCHYGFLNKKLHTIHNFVDLSKFQPIYRYSPHEKREIIVVSSIWYSKNTKIFIEAVRILKSKCNVPFHISWYGVVDKTPYLMECLEKVKKYDISDVISFLPKTRAIVEKYQSSDIFCLPSLFEGTPNALCEAISCGLPVACSDVCDNSRYVISNENGELFDPLSPSNIADVLANLVSKTDEELVAMSKRSRNIAIGAFDISRFGKAYLDLIV